MIAIVIVSAGIVVINLLSLALVVVAVHFGRGFWSICRTRTSVIVCWQLWSKGPTDPQLPSVHCPIFPLCLVTSTQHPTPNHTPSPFDHFPLLFLLESLHSHRHLGIFQKSRMLIMHLTFDEGGVPPTMLLDFHYPRTTNYYITP